MDFYITLIGLAVLALPVVAIAAMVMVVRLRRRVLALELRLGALDGARGDTLARPAGGPSPAPLPAPPAPVAEAPPAVVPPAPQETLTPPVDAAEAPLPSLPEPGLPAAPVPAVRGRGRGTEGAKGAFEDRIGTRWTVWVGGIALALGAVLMVRYSIEQGYFGPGTRILCAALFAAALLAAGEWMRRRDAGLDLPGLPSAYVPAVLTAAGTVAAFATAYGAHALYGFIGSGAAFVLLAVIAVATLCAATLHGPALAGLGLVGALATPLLVSSNDPQPWPLVLYLAFIVAAAYAVARLRMWRWLALAAAVGAGLWGVLLIFNTTSSQFLAVAGFMVSQTLLAGAFLVADPHRGTPLADARLDRFALPILAALAVLGVLAAEVGGGDTGRATLVGLLALIQFGLALRYPAVSPAALLAAAMAAATLALWPDVDLRAQPPATALPGQAAVSPLPAAISLFLTFAAASGLSLIGGALWRLRRGHALRLQAAAPYAAAMTAGPMLLLVVSYWRVTAFDTSVPFAAAAGVLGLLQAGAAGVLKREGAGARPLLFALGACAGSAIGSLALGLTFVLAQGTLTISFAVTALATAWIAGRVEVPTLRYVVGALGCLVLGRLLWDPILVGDAIGTTPVLNWLLWGYGIPAVCFWLSARLLRAQAGDDVVVSLCEGLALLLAFGLVFFEVRQFFHPGDPLTHTWGLAEAGIVVSAAFGFAATLLRGGTIGPQVRRFGALAAVLVAIVLTGTQLLTSINPLFGGSAVPGNPIVNALLPGYLLPAVAAACLAWVLRRVEPAWCALAALCGALVLQFVYTVAAVRRVFQGPIIALSQPTGSDELWSYSIVLLVIGVVALAIGLLRDLRFARLLSAVYIVAAVVKVFLIDLAHLEGMLRALSFIGLGVVLVGIGLAYQRLLLRRPRPAGADDSPGLA